MNAEQDWHLGEPKSDHQRVRRATAVLDDKGGTVDLAGYRLVSQGETLGIWLVYQGTGEDAELVDALNAFQFKTARQVLQYLHQLDNNHATTEGDVLAPEVA